MTINSTFLPKVSLQIDVYKVYERISDKNKVCFLHSKHDNKEDALKAFKTINKGFIRHETLQTVIQKGME